MKFCIGLIETLIEATLQAFHQRIAAQVPLEQSA